MRQSDPLIELQQSVTQPCKGCTVGNMLGRRVYVLLLVEEFHDFSPLHRLYRQELASQFERARLGGAYSKKALAHQG